MSICDGEFWKSHILCAIRLKHVNNGQKSLSIVRYITHSNLDQLFYYYIYYDYPSLSLYCQRGLNEVLKQSTVSYKSTLNRKLLRLKFLGNFAAEWLYYSDKFFKFHCCYFIRVSIKKTDNFKVTYRIHITEIIDVLPNKTRL